MISFCLLLPFAVGWLIYGNIIVYNDAYMCRDWENGAEVLWKLMISWVAFGYLTFLACSCIMCLGVCALCVMCGLVTGEKADKINKMPLARMLSKKNNV